MERRDMRQAVMAGVLGAAAGAVAGWGVRLAALGAAEAARRALVAVDMRWWWLYRRALIALGEDPDALDEEPPDPVAVLRALDGLVEHYETEVVLRRAVEGTALQRPETD